MALSVLPLSESDVSELFEPVSVLGSAAYRSPHLLAVDLALPVGFHSYSSLKFKLKNTKSYLVAGLEQYLLSFLVVIVGRFDPRPNDFVAYRLATKLKKRTKKMRLTFATAVLLAGFSSRIFWSSADHVHM